MRLDRRFLTVLAISLAWATVVAGVFYRLAGARGASARESQKRIVVASRALPAGAMLNREAVALKAVPASMAPAGSFTKLEDVLDRPVVSPIQDGEPVIEARIAAKGSGAGLAPLIPSGMRAISVRVNDVVGVAGFVLPGMRVDVLVTARPPGQTDSVTRTVLQNIQVLSAGQTTQTDGKSQSILTPVVTLLVNPQEAEALTLANNEGRIQLVLRNSTDGAIAATRGRRMREIFGAPSEEDAAPRPAPAPARVSAHAASAPAPRPDTSDEPPAPELEEHRTFIYNGTVQTVTTFRGGVRESGGERGK